MLYTPANHAPLTKTTWDENRTRDSIRAIVADAHSAYDPGGLWPAHEWDGYRAAVPMKNLYVGAAGVVWALERLRRRGYESGLDSAAVARCALELFRAAPDYMADEVLPEPKRSGLLCGESGIVLVAWQLEPSEELAEDLLALVQANIGNQANELMWGVPGTLLAARAMQAATADPRWSQAVRASEDALRSERGEDGLWTQRLWGETFQSLSASHGLVANVAALGEIGNAAEVLRDRATIEDGHANWVGREARLQWCTGGPGIVAHAGHYLDEDLLLAAAQLVWDAGPASDEKGAGLCHGTAGNGYALLKTFARTGDELWLVRARALATHALEQAARLPARYSLFTGGVGAALFAADCIDAEPRFPILDQL